MSFIASLSVPPPTRLSHSLMFSSSMPSPLHCLTPSLPRRSYLFRLPRAIYASLFRSSLFPCFSGAVNCSKDRMLKGILIGTRKLLRLWYWTATWFLVVVIQIYTIIDIHQNTYFKWVDLVQITAQQSWKILKTREHELCFVDMPAHARCLKFICYEHQSHLFG